ncbi:putative methyltransferase [Syncephalis fuscata]|nr:putative methyltransferase [Syncephalis fuscata]
MSCTKDNNTTNASCCPTKEATPMHDVVKDYYGKVLSSSKDLKTSDKFYGCGAPLPSGIDGLTVLDLGSGSGRDCYVAAKLVGPTGRVIGIDMTDEQLTVARNHVNTFATNLGWQPNLEFRTGYIERIHEAGIEDESVDIVISNCVVNLSPDKPAVIRGVYKALRKGGEFYFSDVYADRRLSEEARNHDVLVGECIGGALYTEDFRRICQQVGFTNPRIISQTPLTVEDEALAKVVGNAKFYSITYRLFKVDGLEDREEDYGDSATYLGSINDDNTNTYTLDGHVQLVTHQSTPISGNVARILQSSWLHNHFEVKTLKDSSQQQHYGLFKPTTSLNNNNNNNNNCCSDTATTKEKCC